MLGDDSRVFLTAGEIFCLVIDDVDDICEVFEAEGIVLFEGLERPVSMELLAPENDDVILADFVAVDFNRCEAETGENMVRNGGPFS